MRELLWLIMFRKGLYAVLCHNVYGIKLQCERSLNIVDLKIKKKHWFPTSMLQESILSPIEMHLKFENIKIEILNLVKW